MQRLTVEVDHHVLNARVVIECIHREVFAVARLLVATVWHLGHHWDVGVYPHATEVKILRHAHGSAEVTSPDR